MPVTTRDWDHAAPASLASFGIDRQGELARAPGIGFATASDKCTAAV
jgi:hypothetical protein